MNFARRFLFTTAPFRKFTSFTERIHPPGFAGFSLYEVGAIFFREIRHVMLTMRVAAATYNFIMAIPPTMLFLFSLVPYLPLHNVQKTILYALRFAIPNKGVYSSVAAVVVDFMETERKDVLSFGILLTLFFSSNGMMGLMRSFDRDLDTVIKERTGLKRRWTAIKLTFLLICVVFISIAVFIVQSEMLNFWILKIFGNVAAVRIFSALLLFLIIFCSVSIIYAYGSSLARKFRFISPGSVFATSMIIIVTTVFFFLVNNFLNYNQVYGSIGTLIAFMVWIWLNTMIIMLGYELNISILLAIKGGKANADNEIIEESKINAADA